MNKPKKPVDPEKVAEKAAKVGHYIRKKPRAFTQPIRVHRRRND